MMKLDDPSYSFEQALEECELGITGNSSLQVRLGFSRPRLLALGEQYAEAAREGHLFEIEPIPSGCSSDASLVGVLSRTDLIKLYDQYFVGEKKPGRKVYDFLLNSAKEKCPFCGGIGTARNIDHFLPKAHFPQFSILPRNLVPACRDCNMEGKGSGFARRAEDQRIQPYIDHDRFFVEQWIFARYHGEAQGEPGRFEYFVDPPVGWSEKDKKRVWNQFEAFGLAKRYGTKAAETLLTVLRQMENLTAIGLDGKAISTVLLEPGVEQAPFVNHWQRGMYQALIACLADAGVGE